MQAAGSHSGTAGFGVMTDRDRLLLLAKHVDAFESPGFAFGDWEPSWTDTLVHDADYPAYE